MAKSINAGDDRVMSPLNMVFKVDKSKGSAVAAAGPMISKKIREGADTIGTLHEARFVKLDEDTMMLLTTYDGDFDDYIFDFTKHLAEVFNLILPHAVDPPPLPVQKNPQAFADWVRERDLPCLNDYYSAYPGLSVQDILALDAKNKG